MALKTLEDLKTLADQKRHDNQIGVIGAHDEHTLEAIAEAMKDDLVKPVLYGKPEEIQKIWEKLKIDKAMPEIIPCDTIDLCIQCAIRDVKSGKLKSLMKGKVETGVMMKAIVNRENGIAKNKLLSIVGLFESSYYHKLFAITDVGLVTYPNLEQKAELIKNAVEVMRGLGVTAPKVAALAAIEHENPKMPETADGAALKRMNQDGELKDCVVEGPISFDLAMRAEAAAIKGYQSPVAGDADILLVPDFVSGNLLSKGLVFLGGARSCGNVVGAQVPIVLVSRAATAEDKYFSILLSIVLGK